MAKHKLSLDKVYALLEPGPVVLVSTFDGQRPNVMTLSWHTMMEFEPPLVGCVLSNRDYSFAALSEQGECVINIPTADLVQSVVDCGNSSGRDTDKFARFGLTATPAARVAAPLIEECYANLECQVVDRTLVERYGFFILEVIQAWIDPAVKDPHTLHHRGHGVFAVDGEIVKLRSRMK